MEQSSQLGWFVILLTAALLYSAHGLRCYSFMCTNATMGSPTCPPPIPVTCVKDPGSPVHPDRCVTQRIIAEPMKGIFIHQEYQGCSHYLECDSPSPCGEARGSGENHIKRCDVNCCKGDLCNNGENTLPVPRQARQTGPTGPALSCYACSNVTQPGKRPDVPCNHPIQQVCGVDPLTNLPQDRCVTITMTAKDPGWGHLMHQEMRNCSSAHYCSDMVCKNANHSGILTHCKVSCCFGRNCNNEGLEKMATLPPSHNTTATTEQGVKYARAERPSPPDVVTASKQKPTSTSAGSNIATVSSLPSVLLLTCYTVLI